MIALWSNRLAGLSEDILSGTSALARTTSEKVMAWCGNQPAGAYVTGKEPCSKNIVPRP